MNKIVVEKEKVVELIYSVVDEINQTRPDNLQIGKSLGTPLMGLQSVLDSLGLVSLVVGIEQRIGDDLNVAVTLADEKAMSQRSSPFRTIEALADYVLSLVNV